MSRALRMLGPLSMLAVLALSWGGILFAIFTAGDIDTRYRFLCYACGAMSSVFLISALLTGRFTPWYTSMGLQMFIVVVPYAVWTDAPLLQVWGVFMVELAAAFWGGRLDLAVETVKEPGFDARTERVIARSWMVAWSRNAALVVSAMMVGLVMIAATSIWAKDDVPLLLVAILTIISAISLAFLASANQ